MNKELFRAVWIPSVVGGSIGALLLGFYMMNFAGNNNGNYETAAPIGVLFGLLIGAVIGAAIGKALLDAKIGQKVIIKWSAAVLIAVPVIFGSIVFVAPSFLEGGVVIYTSLWWTLYVYGAVGFFAICSLPPAAALAWVFTRKNSQSNQQ